MPPFNEDAVGRIRQTVRAYEQMPTSTSLAGRDHRPIPPLDFRLKINGATQDGTNFRWSYQVRPQYKTAAGHGGWANHPGFDADVTAYNDVEDDNDDSASGVQSGIQLEAASGIVGILPAPTGMIIRGHIERLPDGLIEYRFIWQNVPEIECPE